MTEDIIERMRAEATLKGVNNPDRHGNEWEDGGVYLVEVAFDSGNVIHLAVAEAKVCTPDGWACKTSRPWGETEISLMQPSYDVHYTLDSGFHARRKDPNKMRYLRIVRKLDFHFGYEPVEGCPNIGKAPWQLEDDLAHGTGEDEPAKEN